MEAVEQPIVQSMRFALSPRGQYLFGSYKAPNGAPEICGAYLSDVSRGTTYVQLHFCKNSAATLNGLAVASVGRGDEMHTLGLCGKLLLAGVGALTALASLGTAQADGLTVLYAFDGSDAAPPTA